MKSGEGHELLIRELASIEELKNSEQFQRDVWGEDDPADNADLLLAMAHEGALVAGAFLHGQMVGFLFGFPTNVPGIQHSHRLGIHPGAQGRGLGKRLKWFQRDWCLVRGIHTVRWTYDPLRHANASLNIARLGATASVYHENYYGDMAGINAGVPSDRIVAEWHLQSARVIERARVFEAQLNKLTNSSGQVIDSGRSSEMSDSGAAGISSSGINEQGGGSDQTVIHIDIPADFNALLQHDQARALQARLQVRKQMTSAFAAGYHIDGYDTLTYRYTCLKRTG